MIRKRLPAARTGPAAGSESSEKDEVARTGASSFQKYALLNGWHNGGAGTHHQGVAPPAYAPVTAF
ncbi:hypothetical protein METH_03930 [Leisingera methylohalidivorans DSM 14336]|uniref:Uncharacterized protein n=1 Tax=Leisingera methylohalidivorans DSM 14336 TaxID=999552 RepID=V9VYQ6_9RHOB|nr:hypothetical protein METH_03930 [Leisingera methylohalidivorans DSM 14336]